MITYEEIIELRKKLDKDEISVDEVKNNYFTDENMSKKSWQTKDWRERRKQVIKDKCEQCGETENLTLYHPSIPEKYDKYYLNAYMYFNELFFEENENNFTGLITKEDILNYIENTPRETYTMCPKCNGNYYTRRKEPHLVCSRCKYEFDEPISKQLPEYIDDLYSNKPLPDMDKPGNAPGSRRVKHSMLYSYIKSKLAYIKRKQMLKDKYQKEIDKKAMIGYLDAQIEYLSLEGTKTLCKKCGFNKNMNGKDLCPVCKKNYKSIKYDSCVDCMPEGEQKNRIKEQFEFNKYMREMESDLGL
jgi:hypothetical protein